MNQRITMISLFDEESLNKIKLVVSNVDRKLNKVPCHIENRDNVDTLPYHVTLSVWDIMDKDRVIELFEKINMEKMEMEIEQIEIKKGYQGYNESFNLYLSVKKNEKLMNIQRYVYSEFPSEKYNPDTYILHISLHSSNNYDELMEIRKKISKSFKPFKVTFDKLGLFEIYPVRKVL